MFPCLVKIVDSTAVFNTKDPIVIGVNVLAGSIRIGTPLCVPDKDVLSVSFVESNDRNC